MRHLILTPEEKLRLTDKLYKWTEWAKRGLQPFHAHLLDMAKVYDAKPEGKTRNFPYQGAPNFVIPAVAIEVDSFVAKAKSRIFQTDPLWTKKGLTQNQTGIEELREAQETFLNYVGIQPGHMDLQPVYGAVLPAQAKLGMAVLKMPWASKLENVVEDDGEVKPVQAFKGPKPRLVPLENMLFHPTNMQNEDEADLLGELIPLSRDRLEERKIDKTYYADAVKEMLAQPDDESATPAQRQAQQHGNVDVPQESEFSAEWRPGEYWMRWYLPEGAAKSIDDDVYKIKGEMPEDKQTPVPAGFYHLTVTFHPKSRQILRAVFNFYPQNIHPYVFWYLERKDGTSVGKGYAEILEEVQRMLSEGKNQRSANGALANCRIWVGKNKLANQTRQMYPNAFWVADNPDADIKSLQMGDVYPSSFEEEGSNWELTSRITGNPQAQQGSGSGQVSKTSGIYTALPALAAMQQGNTRGDIRVFETLYFHMKVGLKAQLMYQHFGIDPDLLKRFGDLGPKIEESFKQENLNKLLIPTRAATSSNNIEVDRQNGQLIDGILGKAAQAMTQMVIAAGNPAVPDPIAAYLFSWVQARTKSLRLVTKAFNQDDTNRLVPDPPGDFKAFRASTAPPPMAPPPGGAGVPPAPLGPPGGGPPLPGVNGHAGGPGVPPIAGQHPAPQLPVGAPPITH